MSITKVFITPDLEQQIKLFYKISRWINKYGFIVLAFILSLLFIFVSSGEQKVVSYKTSILDTNLYQSYIGKYAPVSYKFKGIQLSGNYIFSKTTIKKTNVNLGLGLFKLNNAIVPSFLKLNILIAKDFESKDIKKFANKYLFIISKSKYDFIKVNLKPYKGKSLSIPEMKQKFNLYCLDTLLSNSLFCNANKYYAISQLEKDSKMDLSSEAYKLLFQKLNLDNYKKCSILKKIYSRKLNYSNIKEVVNSYCDNPDEFSQAQDIVSNFTLNQIFTPTLPSTYNGQIYKLVNQWVYMLKTKNVSSDLILSHIDYVKKLMSNRLLDKKQLYLEYIVLQQLKEKNSNNDQILSAIDEIVKGNPIIGFRGISYYLGDLLNKSSKSNNLVSILGTNSNKVVSIKEKLFNLIKKDYQKYFILTSKPNSPGNIQILTGKLLIYENLNNKIQVFRLPVELKVNLHDIIGNKFEVFSGRILDLNIASYMKAKGINLKFPSTLDELSDYLSKVLSNYYLNGGKEKLDLCVKAKVLGFTSCSNNTITLNNQSLHLSFKYIFSGDRLIKVDIPDSIKIVLDYQWAGKDVKLLNLSALKQKLNKLLSKNYYNLYSIKKINNFIQNYIERTKTLYLAKLIGLPANEIINLQNLINKYLGAKLVKVEHVKNNLYKLYISLGQYKIIALYDFKINTIVALALYSQKQHKIVPFGKVKLTLSDVDIEKLNSLKLDPKNFFKQLNSSAFTTYQKLENK